MADPVEPIEAVVFDLWLTLIPLPSQTRGETFQRMSRVLGLTAEELQPHWRATRVERETTDLRSYLRTLDHRLSAGWTEATMEEAMAVRLESHSTCFAQAFSDGEEAIRALRDRELKIGLVSNCTSDVRTALINHQMDCWFDCAILSAEVGVMKPSPEIFSLATTALEVAPGRTLYIGDGGDDELKGAASTGLHPILYDRSGIDASLDFPTISSHLDLLALVD